MFFIRVFFYNREWNEQIEKTFQMAELPQNLRNWATSIEDEVLIPTALEVIRGHLIHEEVLRTEV